MIKTSQRGFYDLNVQESCFQPSKRKNTLETLAGFGYRTIAVNSQIDVDSSGTHTKKKKKKGEPRGPVVDVVPVPFKVEELRNLATELRLPDITFLTRLTLVFCSQDTLQKFIKSPNFKKYDLIAIIPTSMQALMFTCSSLDADILSYDPETRINIKLNRKIYCQLVAKGYHMEINYSPAIEDSTKRKNLINLSHLYHTFGKSRNIIFSSGAEDTMLLRNPYDIISLGFIFGLSALQCKNSVLHCPRNVTVNAVGRRHGKAVMMVENVETMETEEAVLLDSDDDEMDVDEPVQKKPKQ